MACSNECSEVELKVAFHHACQGAGPSNFGSAFKFFSVGYGYWQIFCRSDGWLLRRKIDDGCCTIGDKTLCGMEECIEPLIGGEVRRNEIISSWVYNR